MAEVVIQTGDWKIKKTDRGQTEIETGDSIFIRFVHGHNKPEASCLYVNLSASASSVSIRLPAALTS